MPFVVLVRHGESAINAANRAGGKVFCGQLETPLTERGRQQAREVGEQLARRTDLRIQHAVSSCHGRAAETLALLAQQLPEPLTILKPLAGFNERSLGKFEGRTEAEVFREFPAYRDDPALREFRNHFEQKAPGGENLTEVSRRVWDAWLTIRRQCEGDVLIVSHCMALQTWVGLALNLTREQTIQFHVRNAEPIVFEIPAYDDPSGPPAGYRLCAPS